MLISCFRTSFHISSILHFLHFILNAVFFTCFFFFFIFLISILLHAVITLPEFVGYSTVNVKHIFQYNHCRIMYFVFMLNLDFVTLTLK